MIKYVNGVAVEMTAGEVAAATPSFAELKAAKIQQIAAERWNVETSGFLWQRNSTEAYFIATDADSQAKIDAERKAADAGVRRAGDVWKCGNPATGAVAYPQLTDAEIIAMSSAARDRTSDCFNREAALVGSLEAAADQAALDAVDITTGWPA